MSANVNGSLSGVERLNQFALVIYFPNPLARFLDELRLELIAGCRPRAHVTVLPPRPLPDLDAALEEARRLTPEFRPFQIEMGEIEVFKKTNVIYIGLRQGADELHVMHDAMNRGPLAFEEPYEYHPHITLAQEFPQADTSRLLTIIRERWNGYNGPRTFTAEAAAFVQNTVQKRWLDLATFELGHPAPVRTHRS